MGHRAALLACLHLQLALSSRVAGHDHSALDFISEVARQKRSDSEMSHGRSSAESQGTLTAHDVAQMRGSDDGCMYENQEKMGCHAGCGCSWFEQCYPKFVIIRDQGATGSNVEKGRTKINVGVCGVAMPVLALASVMLFVVLIGSVVAARMLLAKDPVVDNSLPSNGSLAMLASDSKARASGNKEAEQAAQAPSSEADNASPADGTGVLRC
ncbi:unnamed protein product [Effrenium voratum]|uniref:Uncharacterized protein n=1 Tax=Effrenium voratum TaxID=2562239 RepID=A0AA36NCT7_9DINO|nr:unnamed protein product [Effrenium voratum]CAJ1398661.1 unnamed protein product [Effrenium voratum]